MLLGRRHIVNAIIIIEKNQFFQYLESEIYQFNTNNYFKATNTLINLNPTHKDNILYELGLNLLESTK